LTPANFLGDQAQLLVLRPLITKPEMESVWRSLHRRKGGYKPAMTFPYGSREQAGNLYGACMDIELSWSNLPMRTKAESRRYYESIANLALQKTPPQGGVVNSTEVASG
jgi:hypothetical protein